MAALWAVATVAALVVGTLAAAVVGIVAAVGLLAAAAAADRAAATAGRRVAAAWEAHAYGKNKRGWDRCGCMCMCLQTCFKPVQTRRLQDAVGPDVDSKTLACCAFIVSVVNSKNKNPTLKGTLKGIVC